MYQKYSSGRDRGFDPEAARRDERSFEEPLPCRPLLLERLGLHLPPAPRAGLNRLCQVLDLYWSSRVSDLRYKSRKLKKTMCPPSEGWW